MAEVKIAADSGGGSVGLVGPASTTSNAAIQFKLPVADGSAGQVLKTDGSGNLSWYTLPTYTNGITEADQWRINASLSNNGNNDITANWMRSNSLFEKIGTGLTESSGIFTFGATGKYMICFSFYATGNDDRYIGCSMHLSADSGSNYTQLADNLDSSHSGAGTYSAGTIQSMCDVTDISTFRLKFKAVSVDTVTFNSASDAQRTGFTCYRLGDT